MLDIFKAFSTSFAGPVFLVVGLVIIYLTFQTINIDIFPVLTYIVLFGPIWIPVTLFYILFNRWMEFVRLKFEDETGRVTLRIKLPQDVFKSPVAMENVFHQITNAGKATNLIEAYWDGKYPLVHSFELVSIGGDVRFYANVPIKKSKNLIESSLYAQYPGIEVTEEPIDYTAEIKWDPDKWNLMSFHFVKSGSDEFPIKTYVDWGLDRPTKEEERIEPIAPLLEYLGNAKPYERVWIQILATPHIKKDFSVGYLSSSGTWDKKAKETINKMMARDNSGFAQPELDMAPRLTSMERNTIEAIERNVSKTAWEVAIRVMYIADKDKFSGEMITSLLRAMANYEMVGRNKIGLAWRTDFDYKFLSDFSGKRQPYYKRRELDYYKSRLYVPFEVRSGSDAEKVMSIEELATLWYIPGKSVVTPAVSRVESLRRDAPANLPVGNITNSWQ